MCGITGFLSNDSVTEDAAIRIAAHMANRLTHRGPDDAGIWTDSEAGIALAHRRLSVLDLSPAGRQPMVSPSGRFVIIFNGEIYNHRDLRAKVQYLGIEKEMWRGNSDTETLLVCIDAWGFEVALKQTVGMFAIALWDNKTRSLWLARDRMGEKPLYYGRVQKTLVFGSELKALKAFPGFDNAIDRQALTLMMRHNYIPAPYSIYQGICKLPPGTYLKIQNSSDKGWAIGEPLPYWSFSQTVRAGMDHQFVGADDEVVAALDLVLRSAVKRQMVADVPLGAFLSGGIDSSTVVALMQAQSSKPVKTFSIGFHVAGYNEAEYAKAVAKHLATDHTELYVSPKQAMTVIPRLSTLYDEPFSDSSQIPALLVAEMARQHVTVSLSGDAGDELFGGYHRYFFTHNWWKIINAVPHIIRSALSKAILSISATHWDIFSKPLSSIISGSIPPGNFGNKIQKLAGVLSARDRVSLYRHFLSHWPEPEELVIGGNEPPTQISNPQLKLENIFDQMMFMDTLSYLPDDILCKVDRAAMAVSLETRVPFLDHHVVEFAWRLPLSLKIRNGQGKWLLRQVLYQYVPKELIDRPKMGFGVPINHWLRGPLREWAEELLNVSRMRLEGFFNPAPVRRKWAEHLSGKCNWQYHLWDVLMFQAWLAEQKR